MSNSFPATAEMWQDDIPAIYPDMRPRINFLRKIVLWSVGAYIVLNIGFMMVRVPPVGPGIPVGELVLACCLCIISSRVLLPMMAREVWLLPILLWWALSLTRSLIDTRVGGVWSFRDASQEIESLYLIIGFWFAGSAANLEYFFKWIRKILMLEIAYSLLYPVSTKLQAISPKLSGMGTGATSILFSEQNATAMLIWAAGWLLIERPQPGKSVLGRNLFAGFLMAFAVAFGQSRTVDLQVLMLGIILFLVKRKAAAKWGTTVLLGVLIIGAVSISGISLKGRLGEKISLDFLSQHFESLTGTRTQAAGSDAVESESAGVPLRIGWWQHIFTQLKSSPQKAVFGLGFGIPLTDFKGKTAITREPHNSFISVIGRLGISGFLMWVLMQISLYFSWWRSFQLCRRMQWTVDQINLLIILIFCLLTLVVAVGEAAMEVPFYAIPYYFFLGVALRYGRFLRQAAASEAA